MAERDPVVAVDHRRWGKRILVGNGILQEDTRAALGRHGVRQAVEHGDGIKDLLGKLLVAGFPGHGPMLAR